MSIDLSGKVAIITGAGGGLGREHALLLARRGAKVLVNDLGGAVDGEGGSLTAAASVANEINAAGGEAIPNGADVTNFADVEAMVGEAEERWGKVDILVANAGILRDKSFAKMELSDFRLVLDVHLMGSVHCVKALWPGMREREYGRIVLTTSSTGLYGNFGQTNYGAAKLGLVGFMNSLALEGAKYNIHVNSLAPTAGTRMLDGLMSDDMLEALDPSLVSPAVLALVAEQSPTKTIICAGAGSFEVSQITLTQGKYFGSGDDVGDNILAHMSELTDANNQLVPADGSAQGTHELQKAGFTPAAQEA